MSVQRYNFRSRSSSGESNSPTIPDIDPAEGVVTVPGYGFLTSNSLADTIEEAEPVGEDAESSSENLFESIDLQDEHKLDEKLASSTDSPIPATEDDPEQIDTYLNVSSLRPQFPGCGTQVSDLTVSQAIGQIRTINDIPDNSPKHICGACPSTVTHTDEGICCDQCDIWFHRDCVGVSSSDYAFLQEPSYEWFCSKCNEDSATNYNSTHLTQLLMDLLREEVVFGSLQGPSAISEIDRAYKTVSQWVPNVFLTPSGHAGKEFLKIIKQLFDEFNDEGPLRPVAVKMILIAGPLLLQKPSARSKAKDHLDCLARRLSLWKEGNLSALLREGKTIQSKLLKSKRKPSSLKIFSTLMGKGQVSAALKWISSCPPSALPVDDPVIEALQAKHPPAKPMNDACTLAGPVDTPDPILFNSIDGTLVRKAAKLTRGSPGPSGIDAEGWGRILGSKHFKSVGTDLCESFAKFIRILATENVNPDHISALLASRLVPLDKRPGLRPIGIGEILRRIAGKCMSLVLKSDVTSATAPLQTCGGVEGGVEASVHSIRQLYDDPATECVLFVDASNAFNCLNRQSALQNTGVLCPSLYQYLKNLYGRPTDLILRGTGKNILSAEGTTQGCNLAMDFYGIGIMELIHILKQHAPNCHNSWFADDSAGAGKAEDVKLWWEALQFFGPRIGYFPQPEKTCLLIKDPNKLEHFRAMFPGIQVTVEGTRYLGSFIGTKEATNNYVTTKVEEWVNDIKDIATTAASEPQYAYSAYCYGVMKRWSYLMRTTPDIGSLLDPIEKAIKNTLLPALTGLTTVSESLRAAFALSPKNGGLGISNPVETSDLEYNCSVMINEDLIKAIIANRCELFLPDTDKISKAKIHCKKLKLEKEQQKKFNLLNTCGEELGRQVALASEKGASSWLSSLPLKHCGFVLTKQQFQDAIRIRYNIKLEGLSTECACGQPNSIDHALICKLGGYISLRHNHLRDTLSSLTSVVCKDVVTEPTLLPLSNEQLPHGTTLSNDARLDISCRGFYSALDKTFLDIRVLHPNSLSNAGKPLDRMYRSHENEKKTKYLHRVREVEKANFTPFVMSTTGGLAPEAASFVKRLSAKLSQKLCQSYPNVLGYVRRKLRFELLKTTLMALRGFRKSKSVCISELDLNLLNFYVN